MRESLAVSRQLFGCALPKFVVAVVVTLFCATGAVGAETAKPAAGGKPAAPAAAKKKAAVAKTPTLLALPNAHVGQEYQTRIGGVMLAAGETLQCTPPTGMPNGLALDCQKMLIHGHPDAAADAVVGFTVSDAEKHSVPVKFTLTVLDGPDVVVWVAPPAAEKAKTQTQASKRQTATQTNPPAASGGGAPASPGPSPRPAAESKSPAGKHASVAPSMYADPEAVSQAQQAPRVEAEPAEPAIAPVARIVPAVVLASRSADSPDGRPAAGARNDRHSERRDGDDEGRKAHGIGIEVDPETPFVEGATSIKGKIVNDTEQASNLCVALRQLDLTLTEGGDRDSYAALSATKGSKCLAIESPVADGEFSLGLTSPIKAGVTYEFELRSWSTGEAKPIRGRSQYKISLGLPEPRVTVTSLIRDGVSTITGRCNALPNPALTTNAKATPPVVGNLPRVVVELHEPNAPGGPKKEGGLKDGEPMEWHTAELVVGDTKSPTTALSEEAIASADGCTFSVTLKTPLAAGESVRVKLGAPAGRFFVDRGTKMKSEVVWPVDAGQGQDNDTTADIAMEKSDGVLVYTSLAIAPPVITSQVAVGTSIITGTGTPSPSNGTQVTIAAISDDDYEDRRVAPTVGSHAGKKKEKSKKRKNANVTEDKVATATENNDLAGTDDKDATAAKPETQAEMATRLLNEEEHELGSTGQPAKEIEACRSPEDTTEYSGRFLPLQAGSKVAVSTTGTWSITLATPLQDGQRFHLVQVLPPNSKLTVAEKKLCKTTVSVVKGDLDWGRIHVDFVAGVLISNDSANSTAGASGAGSGNFSQAHQFIALNVEKSWALPGCYLRIFPHTEELRDEHKKVVLDKNGDPVLVGKPDQCFDWDRLELKDARRRDTFIPGFSTYFQTRLTAIPVSTVSTSGTSAGTISPTASNIISTAQTARVEVGAYLPFFITRWEYDHKPNALFFAPLGKAGFDTVTGPSTVNTISATGTTQSQTYEQVYSFWSYGARIGHMELTKTENKAPETFSYLDIAFGPYSNLQSYICHPGAAPTDPTTGKPLATNSTCAVNYPGEGLGVDSRKRLYRFDIEGLLKIPKTPLYVGLNANIGQKTLGATHLDHGFAAPDDVRFLFGTKFDVASVLTKFKLGPQ